MKISEENLGKVFESLEVTPVSKYIRALFVGNNTDIQDDLSSQH
jgi:hypothetical protein